MWANRGKSGSGLAPCRLCSPVLIYLELLLTSLLLGIGCMAARPTIQPLLVLLRRFYASFSSSLFSLWSLWRRLYSLLSSGGFKLFSQAPEEELQLVGVSIWGNAAQACQAVSRHSTCSGTGWCCHSKQHEEKSSPHKIWQEMEVHAFINQWKWSNTNKTDHMNPPLLH